MLVYTRKFEVVEGPSRGVARVISQAENHGGIELGCPGQLPTRDKSGSPNAACLRYIVSNATWMFVRAG